ncbi:channel protein hemolysin III family [Firmicutes bacterium CAG:631]|nr:channel protein hemolysin III family [Firmicutes bacterium CAG:631]
MGKSVNKELPSYTKGEEIFNAVSHIVGGAFGIIALILGLVFTIQEGHDGWSILSVIIYGVSIILLYTMSSIYHFLRRNKAKRVFRIFDHCTIYLLIAGTYTPICVILLRHEWWGILLLILVWVAAIVGITFNAINMHKTSIKVLSMILYIVMGWCVIFLIVPLLKIWYGPGFWFLLGGGISYTVGVIFYAFGKKAKYIHSIWHLFVFLGTVLQFIAILKYIIM